MALSIEDREAFLAEPHIGALAVEAGRDRAPLTVPIWYQYSPGGNLWLLTGADSRKLRLLRTAGRCSLMVERLEPTIRYVSVSGPVAGVRPGSRDDLVEMASRYLPAEVVPGYIEVAEGSHGTQSRVEITPQQWLSSDLGSV